MSEFQDYSHNLNMVSVENVEIEKQQNKRNRRKQEILEIEKANCEMENPWNIKSIYEMQYFNCPSCEFKNKSKQLFVNHAFDFHQNHVRLLSNITDNSLKDVI